MAASRLTSSWTVAGVLVAVVVAAVAIYAFTRPHTSSPIAANPSTAINSAVPSAGVLSSGVLVDNSRLKLTGAAQPDHFAVYAGSLSALDQLDWCRSGEQAGANPPGLTPAGSFQFLFDVQAKADVVVSVSDVQVDVTARTVAPAGAELVCGGGSESDLAAHINLDQSTPPVTWSASGTGGAAHSVTCTAGSVCTIDLVFAAKQDLVTWNAQATLMVDGAPVAVTLGHHTLAGTGAATAWYTQRGGAWVPGSGTAP